MFGGLLHSTAWEAFTFCTCCGKGVQVGSDPNNLSFNLLMNVSFIFVEVETGGRYTELN